MEIKDKKELLLRCECSCSVLSVENWSDEEEYYLTFYSYYDRDKSFKSRLKRAWKELIGKGSEGNNIILSKDSFNKLRGF